MISYLNKLIEDNRKTRGVKNVLCKMSGKNPKDLVENLELSTLVDIVAKNFFPSLHFLQISPEKMAKFRSQMVMVTAYMAAHFDKTPFIKESSEKKSLQFYENGSIIFEIQWDKYKIYPLFDTLFQKARIVIVEEKPFARGGFMNVFSGFTLDGKSIVCKTPHVREIFDFETMRKSLEICLHIKGIITCRGFGSIVIDNLKLPLIIEKKMPMSVMRLLSGRIDFVDPRDIEFFILSLFKALKDLHAKKVAHRDIKPDNVLIDLTKRKIRITDFGMMFNEKLKCGTAQFISPEIYSYVNSYKYCASKHLIIVQKIDVWAAGLIAAALLHGISIKRGNILSFFCKNICNKQYMVNQALNQCIESANWKAVLCSMICVDSYYRVTMEKAIEQIEKINEWLFFKNIINIFSICFKNKT